MSVFHAYDVRGLCPQEVHAELAEALGNALAGELKNPGAVGVGYDMRPSSPELLAALSAGLRAAGREVVDLGMLTTPAFYYAVGTLDLAGGVMVTASHNPAEYNGFKICRERAIPIGGNSGLKALEEKVKAGARSEAPNPGTQRKEDLREAYIDHVLEKAGGSDAALRCAIDCGNGVAGPLVERLLARYDRLEADKLFFEPDGTFPNHEANPLNRATLVTLQSTVREKKLDLGIAFDGDGDRVALIDERGEVIASDLLTAFLADELLKTEPTARIVYDLRSSLVVRETIEKAGGVAIEERVGHAFIKKTMRDNDAVFGGELSGHYYWRDNFYADSAFLTLARVLAIMSREGKKLSELIAPYRRTFQSGEINFRVEDKDGKIAELGERFKDGRRSDLDGISIVYDDWWFNVRKSNTEPLLRLNLEARSAPLLEEKTAALKAVIEGR